MIRLLHWAPGADEAAVEDPAEIERFRQQGWIWLDLSGEDTSALTDYADLFGLEHAHVSEALTDSRFSQLEETPGYLFTILFGYQTGLGLRLRTTRLTVFVGDDFLITMSLVSLFTGARASPLPYKLCAPIFASAAALIGLGGFLT